MILLGVDPGIRRLGYAVIEASPREVTLKDFDVLRVDQAADSLGAKLEFIHEEMCQILAKWNPRWVGLEKAVNFKNVDSAFKLTEARGVIRLSLYQTLDSADARLLELSPTAIKKTVTGSGSASKESLEKVLRMNFQGLEEWVESHEKKLTHDAYDALAIAWTTWKKVSRSQQISRAAAQVW